MKTMFQMKLSKERDIILQIANVIDNLHEWEEKEHRDDTFFEELHLIHIPNLDRRWAAKRYLESLADFMLEVEDDDSFNLVEGIVGAIATFELLSADSRKANEMGEKTMSATYDLGFWPYSLDNDEEEEFDKEEESKHIREVAERINKLYELDEETYKAETKGDKNAPAFIEIMESEDYDWVQTRRIRAKKYLKS